MKENVAIRKAIDALKQNNVKSLDEFFEMVIYVCSHGKPNDAKRLSGLCAYVLQQTNYFNRAGRKYVKKNGQKDEPTTNVVPTIQ